jgi:hypothetical protein
MPRRYPHDLIFNLEHQFTLYLQRCRVARADLGPDQLREMRRAFYGGAIQMFFVMTQDILDLKNDAERALVLSSFTAQGMKFWTEEQRKFEAGMDELHPTMAARCDCGWQGIVQDLVPPPEGKSGMCRCPNCKSETIYYRKKI